LGCRFKGIGFKGYVSGYRAKSEESWVKGLGIRV